MAISTNSLMSLLALCALAVWAEQDEVKHSVVGSGISQETSSKNAGTIQAMAPPHSEDDSDYKDNVKLVLEDFELSILESENLQFNSSTVLSALVTTNSTVRNLTEVAASSHRPKLSCLPSYPVAEGEVSLVSLLNGTELQARLGEESNPSLANRTFPANCSLTLFYASWCEFRKALVWECHISKCKFFNVPEPKLFNFGASSTFSLPLLLLNFGSDFGSGPNQLTN